jgi:hypothetical protein
MLHKVMISHNIMSPNFFVHVGGFQPNREEEIEVSIED